ncbi:PH domain-containing protein [Rufibacter hautae]|uniref:PH domain-containing protein n=1 Tax=Rufibacter hautae TaxID=2595005 RepID=A0A5B6TLV7_9BACT|nr:PH domain-containing protein [Rufibacter hautae]KAA3440375.1 PH domain-containing protein [Rufibacter hautae]
MVPLKFSSSKSWFITLVIWGTVALLCVLLIGELRSETPPLRKLGAVVFCLLISGLLLWTWFGTYYRISGEVLQFRCGPLHGRIPIKQIREIKQHQHLWAGLRPALGFQGVVINYNRWDTVYFSPAQKEAFLQALQAVNPQIVVA